MSLTAFNRIRRMQQVEEMKPENIKKAQEAAKVVEQPKVENFVEKPLVPEEAKDELVPEKMEESIVPEEKVETKTAARRKKQ